MNKAHRVTCNFLAAAVVVSLAACGSTPSNSGSTASTTRSGVGPGMNAAGEVVNPKLVEAGYGEKLKGINDWQGEITGKPAPNSKFSQLKIGMSTQQVISLIGQPNDAGAHITGKAFIPFYFGSDRARYEMVFKGHGRLLFATGAGFTGGGQANLIWIIHSANEGDTR